MQTIDTLRLYTYHIYDAAVVDSDGSIRFGRRMVLGSLKPLHVTTTPYSDSNAIKNRDDGKVVPMLVDAFTSMGMAFVHRLEVDDNEVFYITDDMGSRQPFVTYESPMKVISKHDGYAAYEEDVPRPLAEMFMKNARDKDRLQWDQRTPQQLMEAGLAKIEQMGKADAKYGFHSERNEQDRTKATEAGRLLLDFIKAKGDDFKLDPEIMRSAALRATQLHENAEVKVLDGDNERYVVVTATDFYGASIVQNGIERKAERLRVAHPGAPQWHPANDELKAGGYVGHWQFQSAAIATRVPGTTTDKDVVVEYVGYRDLKVMVKDVEAINPAGQVTLPLAVYKALTGTEPEQTLSAEEAEQFTMTHATAGESASAARN